MLDKKFMESFIYAFLYLNWLIYLVSTNYNILLFFKQNLFVPINFMIVLITYLAEVIPYSGR